MTDETYQSRFTNIARLYGQEPAKQIKQLHICVIGLGGVGSWAVEALARSGVGKLTIIDYDTIAPGNINRQLHSLGSTIGIKKNRAMAERIADINPDCQTEVIDDFVTVDNVREYINPDRGYDYVIDAIDSIKFKAAIIYCCRRNKIPVVTIGAAGGLTDPTMIKVKDLSRTYNDPLAAKVRSRLRDEYGFSRNTKRYFGIECIFSSQQQLYPRQDGTVGHDKPGIHGVHLDCQFGYGSASHVTATFGMIAVSRIFHKLFRH